LSRRADRSQVSDVDPRGGPLLKSPQQLSTSTPETAASAQQIATSSEDLASHATQLAELVTRFKTTNV
jgi:hypothetical protein